MRSVFFRYFFRSSLLLLLSLLNLGVVLMVGTSSLLSRREEERMRKTSQEVAKFAVFFNSWSGQPTVSFNPSTSVALTTVGNINSFKICVIAAVESQIGEIVLTSEGPGSALMGKVVPREVIEIAVEGGSISPSLLRGILGQVDSVVTNPISLTINGSEQIVGIVLVTSTQAEYRAVMGVFLQIWLTTLAVVLLLSFALAYFSARRLARPLRQMAACARSYAHGDFSSRVPTTGLKDGETAELSHAFNAMAETLMKAEELRRGFIANVSHELKTPMTTIAGFLDGILDGTVPDEKRDVTLRLIRDEIMRLSRMVSSMTHLTKLQTGQLEIKPRSFDIRELALRVLLGIEAKINSKHLEVELDVGDAEGLMVFADPDYVVQVLTNLLDNAVKFSPDGGHLGLEIHSKGGKTHISISNSGPDISQEDKQRIFDRYYKADRSRSADRTGLGLGLFLVKSILNAHDEDVHVDSGNGLTTFTFTLTEAKSR